MPKARTLPTMGRPQPGRPIAPAQAATQADGPRALLGALVVPIEQIAPDPDQPRRDMGDERLVELAASLTEYGVLQPLLVRDAGLLDDGRTRYMIIAGGRRYAAAQQAGLARLPVVVRESEGATLRVTQLIENVQRQDLAPLEEARAFQELMDAEGLSAEKLGARLHISGQRVRDRLLLLTNQRVSDAVQRDQIPVTVATEILRLPDEGQRQLTPRIDAGEALDRATVRAVRDTLKTAGVANPRAKGGGRPKKGPQSPPQATTDGADYQCGIDIQGSSHPLVPLAGSFSACSARYNVRDDSSKRLLSVRNHFQRRVLVGRATNKAGMPCLRYKRATTPARLLAMPG